METMYLYCQHPTLVASAVLAGLAGSAASFGHAGALRRANLVRVLQLNMARVLISNYSNLRDSDKML